MRKTRGFKFSDRDSKAYAKARRFEDKQKRYYCKECKKFHNKTSIIGKQHM